MTDSQVFIHTWHREGSKSQELSDAIKALFGLISRRNLHLQLFRVPSNENAVDGPSRRFSESDSMLSSQARSRVQAAFWDHCGHSLDLLALDWNAQRDIFGNPLPHLTPFTLKGSAGVNLFAQCPSSGLKIWENPYAFPPFGLVGAVLQFLLSFHITFTIGVPLFSLLPVWWPVLRAESSEYFRLGATENDFHAIMSRSKQVFVPFPCPYELWVFRVPERDY